MIKISKNDAFYMRSQGYENFVKKSKSKHPTYYLVEEPDIVRWDRKLHKQIVTKEGALTVYRKYLESQKIDRTEGN